jgi:hypothetical protein
VIEGAVYFRDQTLYFSVDKHTVSVLCFLQQEMKPQEGHFVKKALPLEYALLLYGRCFCKGGIKMPAAVTGSRQEVWICIFPDDCLHGRLSPGPFIWPGQKRLQSHLVS